jgi:hypothetical protein
MNGCEAISRQSSSRRAPGGSAGSRRCAGVNCQERTREDLLETLEVTLAEAIELEREVARRAAGESPS